MNGAFDEVSMAFVKATKTIDLCQMTRMKKKPNIAGTVRNGTIAIFKAGQSEIK